MALPTLISKNFIAPDLAARASPASPWPPCLFLLPRISSRFCFFIFYLTMSAKAPVTPRPCLELRNQWETERTYRNRWPIPQSPFGPLTFLSSVPSRQLFLLQVQVQEVVMIPVHLGRSLWTHSNSRSPLFFILLLKISAAPSLKSLHGQMQNTIDPEVWKPLSKLLNCCKFGTNSQNNHD